MEKDDEILAELRKISELLKKPADPPRPKGMVQEFKAFLSEYKVLGLAVAFILGIYLGNVVKALVTDMIMPIVSFTLPSGIDINKFMAGPFGVGDFVNNALTFIIVAFVIFLIVKAANRYKVA